jgi:glutathione S-transferase
MKLYSTPLASSVAAQIALIELGIPHTVEFVDIFVQPHVVLSDGTPYARVNPKEAVPALQLDSGELLTEVGVILQFIGELTPNNTLLPAYGTLARFRVMEWLSYIGSDLHKSIGPTLNPQMPEAGKEIHRQNINRRLSYIDAQLEEWPYLTGNNFTVADAYLFVMMGYGPYLKFDFSKYENLVKFHKLIASRPSFLQAVEANALALQRMKLPVFTAGSK